MAAHFSGLKSTVHVRNLTRRFGERVILDQADLDIAPGEFVALLGRSGSGKSTFLRALAGLDHDVSGSGTLEVPRAKSVIFQDARLLPWKRVRENILLGLNRPDAEAAVAIALSEVGLEARANAYPVELSGGEQQRVALARSLLREPQLILADEPFSALDALTRINMQQLLRDLVARHRPAVLFVTHDVEEAVALANRAVVLENGRLILDLPIELPHEPIARDHRRAQLRSILLERLGVHVDEGARGSPNEAAA